MGKRGRRKQVGYGTSNSSKVQVRPEWKTPRSHQDLARALAVYLLCRLEQEDKGASQGQASCRAQKEGET